jgi:hypothetical protein
MPFLPMRVMSEIQKRLLYFLCLAIGHLFSLMYKSTPNAWVSRATAKQPTSRARPAEPPAPSQAQNAAAVASVAPFVGRAGARLH